MLWNTLRLHTIILSLTEERNSDYISIIKKIQHLKQKKKSLEFILDEEKKYDFKMKEIVVEEYDDDVFLCDKIRFRKNMGCVSKKLGLI